MAVVIETTLGDFTVDLFLEQRPTTCLNFLKLCKMKYYNFNLFHTIRNGFIAQTGDPTGEGSGGESIFGLLEGPSKRFFSCEKMPKIRHTDAGLLSMVCTGEAMVGSQFFITLGTDLDSLDGVHCVIGEVTEGHDVLRKLNDVICDETNRPYQDVRITHTVVLADPFNDPTGLREPSRSPSPSAERLKGGRIAPDEDIDETQGKTAQELQELIEEKEAKARATILEIVGDLPDADIAPPENVLFVCKLNPVTSDEDLEIIFSRFGKIVSCEVIRDKKTGDSLQYAFIEFSDKKSCENAYFKMDNVLIDDRRIHVDFSQSVSKIQWLGKGRGVKHITEDISQEKVDSSKVKTRERSKRSPSKDRKRTRDYEHDRQRIRDKEGRNNQHEREHKSQRTNRENDRRDTRKLSKSRSPVKKREEKPNRDRKPGKPSNERPITQQERPDRDITRNSQRNNENFRNGTDKVILGRSQTNSRNVSNRDIKEKTNTMELKHDKEKHRRHKDNDRDGHREKSRVYHKHKEAEPTRTTKEKSTHKDTRKDLIENKKKETNTVKEVNKTELKTPSPKDKKQKKLASKKIEKSTKDSKKIKTLKKKRKPSTSSSSSSSSSSSETSSSSDSDHKKKKRKRKYSTSESSTSSSSSSSSSSSDSSSTSSTSSSDSLAKKEKLRSLETKKHQRKLKTNDPN